MLRLPFTLCGFVLLALSSQAQTYFNQRYPVQPSASGFPNNISSIVNAHNGYVTCGQTYDYPYINQSTLTLRLIDTSGQLTRTRYYGSPTASTYSAFGNSLLALQQGGGFVMPATYASPPGANRAILWRFDAQGDTLWTRRYPSANNQIIYAGCRVRDGGFTLFGSVVQNSQLDFLLIRTDSLGRQLWQQTYDRGYDDDGLAITQTPDGGFLLVGYTIYQPNGPDQDSYIVKTDSLGHLLWERTFSSQAGSGLDAASSMSVLRDGNYLIGAMLQKSFLNGLEQQRNILYKLSPLGQLLWQREIGPTRSGTSALAVHELSDGTIVVAGQQGDPTNATPVGNGFPEGFVYKVCADGDSVWYRSYKLLTGGRSHNYIRDLRPTPDGGFVGAGFAFPQAPDTGVNDGWVFKLDSAGYLQAGGTPPTRVCPRPQVGLPPDEAAAQSVAIWPNPAPDGRFTLQAPGATTYTVADALGREVAHGAVRAGENGLDLSRHPSGLYLLRLMWPDGRLVSRKLLR